MQQNPLTPREYEIARIVASGKSNQAAAVHLCLSRRTVENHLYSIFSKMDVSNRTELALVFHFDRTGLERIVNP